MSLTKRLVILAGLIGILFYTATFEQLESWIIAYQLDWYGLGVPLAWGIILGGLCALVGIKFLDKWLPALTLAAAMLLTMGLTGSAAVGAKHQLLVLVLPTLQIASIGLGVYLFAYAFARFAGAERARKADKQKSQ